MDEFSPACPSVMHIFSQAVAANPPPEPATTEQISMYTFARLDSV